MTLFELIKKSRQEKGGFTLVELIVTLAVLSIALVVAGNMLFFGNNMFAKTEVKNSEKFIGDSAYKYMKEKLVYATKIEIIDQNVEPKSPKYPKIMYAGKDGELNGHLVFGEKLKDSGMIGIEQYSQDDVFGPEFYGNYVISYKINIKDDKRLELIVSVKNKNENNTLYSTGEVIKNLNLANSESKIETVNLKGMNSSEYDNPTISYDEDVTRKSTYTPLDLRNQMADAYDKYVIKKDKEFQALFKEVTGYGYASNSTLRSFVSQYYYSGEPYKLNASNAEVYSFFPDFPGIPEKVIEAVDERIGTKTTNTALTLGAYLKKKQESNDLKMEAYICLDIAGTNPQKGDGSCFVYVPKKSGEPWSTKLIYNHEDGYWYFFLPNNENAGWDLGVTIANRPWKSIEGNSNDGILELLEGTGKEAKTGTWIKVVL